MYRQVCPASGILTNHGIAAKVARTPTAGAALKHPIIASLAFFLATSASLVASAADANPYVLKNTDVVDVRARQLNRDYQLLVSLPPSYGQSTRRYPVVFVTDADYAFPLIRSMARRLGTGSHGVEEFILVGLSYAKGDTPEYSRRRDYTPAGTAEQGRVSDMPGRVPKFGESEGYRRFIKDEVFPVIAQRYRADMERKVFAGHSYGSLLGLHIAFTEPAMFSHYILGSPSLWFGKRVMFDRDRAYRFADGSAHFRPRVMITGATDRWSSSARTDVSTFRPGYLRFFRMASNSRRSATMSSSVL